MPKTEAQKRAQKKYDAETADFENILVGAEKAHAL